MYCQLICSFYIDVNPSLCRKKTAKISNKYCFEEILSKDENILRGYTKSITQPRVVSLCTQLYVCDTIRESNI